MKRFNFRFEAVEKVRKSREEEALRLLARAQQLLKNAKDEKESLVNALNDSLLRREKLAEKPLQITAYQLENDFIAGTKQRIIQTEHSILKANRGVEKAIRTYLHARRQLKIIETLREKQFSDYRQARKKWEQKQQDDVYIMRARLERDIA